MRKKTNLWSVYSCEAVVMFVQRAGWGVYLVVSVSVVGLWLWLEFDHVFQTFSACGLWVMVDDGDWRL